TTTDPINGIGNEGCTLSFGTALNRMNASAQLSTPLECTGQQYSENQSNDGYSSYDIGHYSSASVNFLDCSALFSNTTSNYNYHWEEIITENGITSYVLVLELDSSSIDLDCDETTVDPDNPCPPGYFYSPGGGDPCKPIKPILENLQNINLIPIDIANIGSEDEHDGDKIEKGLYLMILNFRNNISIPIYKKIENNIFLRKYDRNNTNDLVIFIDQIEDELSLSLNKDEHLISYSIFDIMGNGAKKGDFLSKSNKQRLDISELRKGIYFLNIETNNQRYTKKIIKE
ncbi:T9SS type A sorting domain-containing protein, partial [Aquimarina rhabdastrellae]